jgi:protocatechuate 4,5-dioxygenase, beta chain
MAKIVGGLATSHIPAIGGAIAKGLQHDPYWKPFFDGFKPAREWLAREKPDVVVVFYNDHGLNFFLDKMPTFAVGAAPEYRNDDEGWGIPTLPPFEGIPELSWAIIDHLIARDFDIVTCQEMLVDHAFTIALKLFWPDGDAPPAVPACINTVQFPLPSAKRCYALGRAVGEAISAWDKDLKVVTIGSGGLSHQLEGKRAGFINKPFDLKFIETMVDDPEWVTQFSILELVERTGTQGVELVNWLAARAAASPGPMRKVSSNYHIPISNTAAATLVLEAA